MNFKLLFHTLQYLRPTQIYHQVLRRVVKHRYAELSVANDFAIDCEWQTEPIPRWHSLDGKKFTFINLTRDNPDWSFMDYGPLWNYNLNYFDFINGGLTSIDEGLRSKDEGLKTKDESRKTKDEGTYWIDKFINELPNNQMGLDPYPIALRGINWIKFLCRYPECATPRRINSLFSQYHLLEQKLEYHLLANHLLEDAFSLYIGAVFFNNAKMFDKASKLLLCQLHEQILPDGAHYEQSPMYHCILLDRLLDCINIGQKSKDERLKLMEYAERMLGWLESICYKDGTYPLMNDAAEGIAPTPKQIFDYADRLGIKWKASTLLESGYRKLNGGNFESVVDIGNITATYQPGHTHADSLNYELRIDGKPFVVDTGISTYNKTPRRQFERSTIAHNCVVSANNYGTDSSQSSSQVWGGFRVGKRCKVSLIKDSAKEVRACHNGFAKSCSRLFRMEENTFVVEDQYEGEGISLIHLAQDADLSRIHVEGASKIEIVEDKYSVEYNRFLPCKVMKIYFTGKLKYTIR